MGIQVKTVQSDNVVKAKARPITKGFSQEESADFFGTLASTPCTSWTRLEVIVALTKDLDFNYFDTEQRFVKSKPDTTVYMMPHGCGDIPRKTVLLKKSLYELRQGARTWHDLPMSTL